MGAPKAQLNGDPPVMRGVLSQVLATSGQARATSWDGGSPACLSRLEGSCRDASRPSDELPICSLSECVRSVLGLVPQSLSIEPVMRSSPGQLQEMCKRPCSEPDASPLM